MAAMPIYGEKHLKIFSGTKKASRLNLVTEYWGLWSSKFVKKKMMTLGWHLTFLWHGQIGLLMHLYGETIENSVSQNVLKTSGWNLQCMIKVANPFSYNQNFVPQGYLPLPLGNTCIKNLIIFKRLLLWNSLTNFQQLSHWALCQKCIINLLARLDKVQEELVQFPRHRPWRPHLR